MCRTHSSPLAHYCDHTSPWHIINIYQKAPHSMNCCLKATSHLMIFPGKPHLRSPRFATSHQILRGAVARLQLKFPRLWLKMALSCVAHPEASRAFSGLTMGNLHTGQHSSSFPLPPLHTTTDSQEFAGIPFRTTERP